MGHIKKDGARLFLGEILRHPHTLQLAFESHSSAIIMKKTQRAIDFRLQRHAHRAIDSELGSGRNTAKL